MAYQFNNYSMEESVLQQILREWSTQQLRQFN